ncbi:acyl-CoA dehydrogenase family protein [Microbacterium sp. ZXX196]|uniref:acyl-CoA dehydrogenase family protein n=1 Tax=Microbacterium sp. ZXX196 TaxID=2609291 RepID=UPI001E5EC323|nr:acyl-CoA dehydrogenase family protein [Microbacterium sp. ZXX196]
MTNASTMPTTIADTTGLGLEAPDSAAAILRNTDRILPLIASEADAIEQAACLTDRAAAAMRGAGVFQMAFPASRGGVEMTLEQQVEVTARVAAVDASAGWNVGVLNATGYYAGRLGDEAYAELYPSRDMPTAGAFHPRGRADIVPGGYLVSGQWGWGSGSYTAEHIIGGAEVYRDGTPVRGADGAIVHRGFWLPLDAVEIAHDWQVLGVRGSGSTSFAIREPAFVPAHHSFDREAPDRADGDPLDKAVQVSHFALTGVALGIARHAVELAGDFVRGRLKGADALKVDAATRQALGEAMSEVDFAFAGVREVARRTDEVLFRPGAGLTTVQRTRMVAANAMAARSMKRAVDLASEISSAAVILDKNPMQRVVRDSHGALAHAGSRRTHFGAMAAAALAPGASFTLPSDPAWARSFA